MNHQRLIELGLQYAGTSLRYPFDPDLPVLYVGNKMFALLGHTGSTESVNLKAHPDEAWLLRETYAGSVLPGYHMNKRHWNTVVLDGNVPDEVIEQMLDVSYRLVTAKMTRAERAALEQGGAACP